MELTEDALGVLNTQLATMAEELTGLCEDEIDASFFSFDAWGNDVQIPKVLRISHILLLALHYIEDQSSPPPPAPSTLDELYSLACNRGPHFPVTAASLDYRLLHFLATETQAGLLMRRKQRQFQSRETRVKEVDEPLLVELRNLARAVDLDGLSQNYSAIDLLEMITKKVDEMIQAKMLSLSGSQRILAHIPALTAAQRTLLQPIERALHQVQRASHLYQSHQRFVKYMLLLIVRTLKSVAACCWSACKCLWSLSRPSRRSQS